jgi:hypothetical protein
MLGLEASAPTPATVPTPKTSKEDATENIALENSATDAGVEDEEKLKKKQMRSKIIKGIVIAAILYEAYDMMNEPATPPTTPTAKTKKAKAKTKQDSSTTPIPTAQPTISEFKPTLEPAHKIPTEIPTAMPIPTAEPVIIPTTIPTIEPKIEAPIIPTIEPTVAPVIAPAKPAGQNMDNLLGEIEEKKGNAPTKKHELTKPINYEKLGPGLIYNCEGGHWACVDRDNYFNCRSAEQQVENSSAIPACAISDVYASVKDCQIMQIYNVNMAKLPDKCKKTVKNEILTPTPAPATITTPEPTVIATTQPEEEEVPEATTSPATQEIVPTAQPATSVIPDKQVVQPTTAAPVNEGESLSTGDLDTTL